MYASGSCWNKGFDGAKSYDTFSEEPTHWDSNMPGAPPSLINVGVERRSRMRTDMYVKRTVPGPTRPGAVFAP
jgi:hypothetical protein